MKDARALGSYVEKLAKENSVTTHALSEVLNCREAQVEAFFKGRAFVSYAQLTALAEKFRTTTATLMAGDLDYYNENVVHCMNDFSNNDNREKILNIIDEYMDINDSVS